MPAFFKKVIERMTLMSRRHFCGAAIALATTRAAAAATPAGNACDAPEKALVDYFRDSAPGLLRQPSGFLQFPSISPSLPGKQYSAELWDWDTLWTARGLFALADATGNKALAQKVAEHAKGSLLNFTLHQTADGRLPIMLSSEIQNPDFIPFSTPDKNQAKPVMAQLALLVADRTGDAGWCRPIFDQLLRFHESWLAHNESASGLLVWSNDVATGNDNDPTTFGRPPFSSANLLLNCLFFQDCKAALELSRRMKRPADEQKRLQQRVDRLKAAILQECWDPRDAFFYTVDIQSADHRAELLPEIERGMNMSWQTIPLRIQTFTGFLPLWCGVATAEQAAALIDRNYRADDRFRAPFGVRTLSRLERMYALDASSNPSNWLGPVWIVSNYLVWKALSAYGYPREAQELAGKTLKLLAMTLEKDGSLNEYYHPDTGAALSHKGFMDWSLLSLEMIGQGVC